MTNAMMDVTCPKCKKKIGWYGSFKNKPSCPKCGFREPQEKLDEEDEKWQKELEQIFHEMEKEDQQKLEKAMLDIEEQEEED